MPTIRPPRRGFSLMEMIVATAILAGSGAALFTLIGQGSQFGRRAEQQAAALQLAQSVLAESLAMPGAIDEQGTFDNDPRWAYRLSRAPLGGSGPMAGNATATDPAASGSVMTRVTVEIFPAAELGGSAGGRSDQATCRLVRWVRGPRANSAEKADADAPLFEPPSLP